MHKATVFIIVLIIGATSYGTGFLHGTYYDYDKGEITEKQECVRVQCIPDLFGEDYDDCRWRLPNGMP